MFVKPAPGLTFRDPVTKARVPSGGMEVPDGDLNWARLIATGDAVEIDAIEEEPPAEPAGEAPPPAPDDPAASASAARKTKPAAAPADGQ